MTAETNAVLKTYPIKLLQVDFQKSTNTKSLKAALSYLEQDHYDIALILDADNYVKTTYLADINDAFAQSGVEVVQTHRVAKNLNTDMVFLFFTISCSQFYLNLRFKKCLILLVYLIKSIDCFF